MIATDVIRNDSLPGGPAGKNRDTSSPQIKS